MQHCLYVMDSMLCNIHFCETSSSGNYLNWLGQSLATQPVRDQLISEFNDFELTSLNFIATQPVRAQMKIELNNFELTYSYLLPSKSSSRHLS